MNLIIAFLFSASITIIGSASVSTRPRVLVLGGTGFVGGSFISQAVIKDFDIVSISRRGKPSDLTEFTDKVTWLQGDAVDPDFIDQVLKEHGPFDACVHAVGLLFDSQSGLKPLNKYASGSKSLASDDATYDRITRMTAFNAIEAFTESSEGSSVVPPFLFVSAAEAGWTFDVPVDWLQRYLVAKRAVEKKLLNDSPGLRSVIFRPSLIWTWKKPAALVSVIPFYIGSKVGLPFVDRPVLVETLVNAMVSAIECPDEKGIMNFREMDRLAALQQKL